jgi:ATP-binding cassette subfamily F protein 3
MEGTIIYAKKLQIAYFSQQLSDELATTQTPFEILSSVLADSNETKVRAQLARFGLTQQKSDTRVQNLSGGEKTRLLLAIITRQAPHILILDEPTNHLDIEAKDALIDALNAYEGAVVLVSHDFYLVESVCDQLLLVRDHRCQNFPGDLGDYMEVVLAEKRAVKKLENVAPKQQRPSTKNENRRKKMERELERLMRCIHDLNQRKQRLESEITTAYDGNLPRELALLLEELGIREQEWLKLSEAMESGELD